MADIRFPNRILRRFAETVNLELGTEQFAAMLGLSKLPAEWSKPDTFLSQNPVESAKAYAALQDAMRTYFGRGARGVLLRVGGRLWNHLLEDATFAVRAQASVVRRLPLSTRHKPTLDMLIKLLGAQSDEMTVHTLDLDLLLVDRASPTATDRREAAPICFVTQGLIHESLSWSTGRGYDVEETSCKAMGHHSCEFKITLERRP